MCFLWHSGEWLLNCPFISHANIFQLKYTIEEYFYVLKRLILSQKCSNCKRKLRKTNKHARARKKYMHSSFSIIPSSSSSMLKTSPWLRYNLPRSCALTCLSTVVPSPLGFVIYSTNFSFISADWGRYTEKWKYGHDTKL